MADAPGKPSGSSPRQVAANVAADKRDQDSEKARRAFAQTAIARLAATGFAPKDAGNSSLPPVAAEALKTLLAAQGISAPEPKTWSDAFVALTRDDGAGHLTLDLQLLQASTLVSKPGWSRIVPSLADLAKAIAGKAPALKIHSADAFLVEPANGTIDAPVQYVLLASGDIAPRGQTLPPGSKPITWARLTLPPGEGPAHLALGDQSEVHQEFDVFQEGGSVTAILDDLLAQASARPKGLPPGQLRDYEQQRRAQRAFAQGPMPKEPGAATVWRAARLTPAAYDAAASAVAARLGVQPKRWLGYMNDHRLTGFLNDVCAAALPERGIFAAFLYSVAVGEGLGLRLDSRLKRAEALEVDIEPGKPGWHVLDGFASLGLDTFGERYPGLKQRGFLPADFTEGRSFVQRATWGDMAPSENEKGTVRASPLFRNMRSGMQALAATLAQCRLEFLADLKAIQGPAAAQALSEDQLNFFTYVYFNLGAPEARKLLAAEGPDYFSKWKGPPPPDNRTAKFNALERVAFTQVVNRLGLFEKR